MAWFFGDGFDLYQQTSDAYSNGTYWDTYNSSYLELGTTTRFSSGKSLVNTANNATGTVALGKSSGSNDAVHHINLAFYLNETISTGNEFWITLFDGTTAQCSIVFTRAGSILLTSGASSGTTLATYSSAFLQGAWNSFEIEVVINNTTGSFTVRKNGNTSNDSQTTGLNTRASANNYANKIGMNNARISAATWFADDLLWRSDSSSVSWAGDIRCHTRLPASDAAAVWTRSGSTVPVVPYVQSTTANIANGTARYAPFTTSCTGTLGSVVLSLGLGYTGNMKCTLFANNSGAPGSVLGSAGAVTNPVTGNNTFTFSSPPSVTQGTQYWLGFDSDTAVTGGWNVTANNGTVFYTNSGATASVAYASFPTANPSITAGAQCPIFTANLSPTTTANANLVADTAQDGTAGYVFDGVAGDTDLYNLQSISSTPSTIIGVTTRFLTQKSDAGTRTVAAVLKSGSTTSAGIAATLNTVFGWVSRSDTTDPNTGAAWTAANVNSLQIGPKVVS